ncbi:MAG: hypothetical protein A2X87_00035 [Deltaproteobacteria bacterium GWC2_42_51]|nr:MAG: hypothetical protein A2056_03830 [Deltaproteobacteria bacterium GWA2_42_85]OGP26415.1 MAG: hypothetical protein A2067_01425 [Deltaproteobacteria bacterium GWB2_42_7]OGP34603.1 MAG: hypothetical protein A2X87_00035 [Deltaproteobacteria bacterium GWC2_42_51]OGP42158.1 MAG: hypothetical protein A2090_02550 [Deltaproteobacteria bacterium GWD2_42_10]OGP48562.1 MAG: hypothetical protein A2022_09025 [Deltaproteobacteria bacterium GWF2_42_12]OGQ29368.1 MAG: hypothetical protein A3D29_03155 [De
MGFQKCVQDTLTFCAVFLMFFLVIIGCSVKSEIARKEGDVNFEEKRAKVTEFVLGPGDEIEITVYRNEDLNRKILIPPDGIISYPLIGEIKVGGTGITLVRRQLTEELNKYIINPQVSISVLTLRSQKIFVLGEVGRPGMFQINGPLDAVEAISMAGGLTLDANGKSVLLIRGDMSKPEIKTLNIADFFKKGEFSENASLQKGDIIYVPSSYIASVDRFFKHLQNIISPIVLMETGIVLEPLVEDVFSGEKPTSTLIIQPR